MTLLKFLMEIIKLVLIIINISYFLGFFWFITCDLIRIVYGMHLSPIAFEEADINTTYFLKYYELYATDIDYHRTDA